MPLLAFDTVKSARPAMQIGQNSAFNNDIDGDYHYINAVKHGRITSTSGTGTYVKGYPGLLGGGSYTIQIHGPRERNFQGDPADHYSYLFTGVWTLRWNDTSGSVTCAWVWKNGGTPTGVDVSGADPNYDHAIEYTVTDPTANNGSTEIQVSGTGAITDLELITPGDKVRYDAGERFNSQFLADNAGIEYWRPMEGIGTNDSPIRNYTDFRNEDQLLYFGARGQPIEYAVKAAKELGAKLWFNMPAMATTACKTSVIQEVVNNYGLTGPQIADIIWETTNEYWNFALGFHNDFRFMFELEGTVYEITSTDIDTSTGIYTAVGHGLTDDKLIYGYDAIQTADSTENWFRHGIELWAIYIDDDHFQLTRRWERGIIQDINPNGASTTVDVLMLKSDLINVDTVHQYYIPTSNNNKLTWRHNIKFVGTGVSQLDGNTYEIIGQPNRQQIEIDVDSTSFDTYVPANGGVTLTTMNYGLTMPVTQSLQTNQNFLRYTISGGGTKTNHENYIDQTRETWTLVEAEVGAGNLVKILAGQGNSVATCIGQLQYDPDIWSELDYYAIGAYFQTKPTDYENKTPTEMTDGADYNRRIAKKGPMLSVERHYGAMGSFRVPIIIYEGGDHNGGFGSTQEELEALVNWARDPEATRAYTEYIQNLANFNVALLCHFVSAFYPDTDNAGGFQGTFGCMAHTGATDIEDRRQYDGIQPYYANGIRPV